MNYTYVVYVDVLFTLLVANLAFDYCLLWATGSVTGRKSSTGRLLLGATIGTLYFFLVYFAGTGLMPGYGILRFPPIILAIGAAMIGITYQPHNGRQFLQLLGYFAAIGLIAGGAGLATAFLTGTEEQPDVWWGTVTAMATILLIAELGWGVVHRTVWERLCLVPLEIGIFGNALKVSALIDTGNRLRDPLSGRPVVIIELDSIRKIIPANVAQALRQFSNDSNLSGLDPITEDNTWASRFCLLPFSTLTDRTGLMAGIKPDYVKLTASGKTIILQKVVLGLCVKPLDQTGSFQALVPPELLEEEGVTLKNTTKSAEVLSPQKGESVNA